MKQTLGRLQKLASFVIVLAIMATAYAQAASCQTEFPKCSDSIEVYRDVQCTSGGSYWQISEPIPYYLYACNNWYSGCGGTPGSGVCNVMVRYDGMGRTITCPDTGQTTFCIEYLTGSVNLNVNCSGGPCPVPGGVNDTPAGYPPADGEFLDETNPWQVLPHPAEIPSND